LDELHRPLSVIAAKKAEHLLRVGVELEIDAGITVATASFICCKLGVMSAKTSSTIITPTTDLSTTITLINVSGVAVAYRTL
jgi:hypothetical protein